ncbi:dTDP-glucose 4,6-dehydratase [Paenibacillus rhizovicinus]|uniref:dTDP-glucose 4,6-dehydratase n=1 Tax=Paenibacillus rhizovicinus TaxID=2704463 RepID=A0A6C0P0X7_9BACL|nr:dTDP-glucose 4,6-dehydratase [Paenibacillus rhizovicinus]QHW31553.1 dTDP-glucose 4,6-dehydratase [Paenibacillus rhizovicinus]
MKILITGGAGFIGSNFVHYMRKKHPSYDLLNVDALTYAGNLTNLDGIEPSEGGGSYRFVRGDIRDRAAMEPLFQAGVDAVINFAAESHVDRSIAQPDIFVTTNVVGAHTLLDLARTYGVRKFIQISTDEVYGTLGDSGLFAESTPLAPNSPYSASKAAADLLVRAYHETYGMDVNITRCSNNYGPYQFPEKLIPLMISRALQDLPLPLYGDGLNVRDWLYVEDHCSAVDLVLHRGVAGEVYNIGGRNERTNAQVVATILEALGKPASLIAHVPDRLGHDRRYAIDADKIRAELGWKPEFPYERGIQATIEWYVGNAEWMNRITTGVYRSMNDAAAADNKELDES